MLRWLCAAALAGVLAGGCSYTERKTVVAPGSQSASYTCISQGYPSGTPAYDACVARQAAR